MMHKKSLFGWLLLLGLICSPGSTLLAQGKMSADLKQFLESRSFPDLIASYKQDHLVLNNAGKRLKRIEAQPFTLANGFRCQAFAGYERDNAMKTADQVRALKLDSVYVIRTESDLYKVQVGNFQNKDDAYTLLQKLLKAGITGAWVVETDIHQQKSLEEQQAYQEKTEQIARQEAAVQQSVYFAIQIFATNDSLKAAQLKELLGQEVSEPVTVVQQATIWKVVVGQFYDRASADEFLKVLKKRGYNDAWITQIAS